MSSSTITPLTLNGISQYASDFQSILNRAVQVASIPVQQLQNEQTVIQNQNTAASSLSSAVAAVATDLGNLGSLGTSKALSANTSNSSIEIGRASWRGRG